MATKKPAAKPVAAKPAPAAKAAAKPAAKAAAKPAAAPVEQEVQVGSMVRFLGYADDVAAEDRVLEQDGVYEVVELTGEGEDAGYVVSLDNPEFDPKKKVNEQTNPKTIEADVFTDEVELVVEEGADPVVAPEVTKVKSGKKPVKEVAAEKPAKAKGKEVVKAAPAPVVAADTEEELPDLENEDPDVVALVDGSENLVETLKDLEADIGTAEYQIGGVLYHLKKSGEYKDMKKEYAENKGFALFLSENLNIDYRKAMYLIEIYVNFTLAGIENPAERVAQIGWTKASKIAKLMVADDQEPEELLTLAAESTVKELSEAISEQTTHVGGTKGEAKKRITMKFRYFEEEGTALVNIIKDVQITQALKSEDEALAFILQDWASQNAGGVATEESAPVQTAPVGRAAKAATAKPAVAKARAKA